MCQVIEHRTYLLIMINSKSKVIIIYTQRLQCDSTKVYFQKYSDYYVNSATFNKALKVFK